MKGIKRNQGTVPRVSQTKHYELWHTTKTTPKATIGDSPCVPHPRCHHSREGGGRWGRSGAAGYGTKKTLEAAMPKKRVGKISAAQWAANKRRV